MLRSSRDGKFVDGRSGKFADTPKTTQVEVVYRTYPSATGPKNLTPQQIKKALAAA